MSGHLHLNLSRGTCLGDPNPSTRPHKADLWPGQNDRGIGNINRLYDDPTEVPDDVLCAVSHGYPEATVQMVTPTEFQKQMGHPPERPDRNGCTPEARAWQLSQAETAYRKQPTDTVVSGMDKVTRLLNGELVSGELLLQETPPTLDDILTSEELAVLDPDTVTVDHHPALNESAIEEAFSEADWYQAATRDTRTLLESTYVAGFPRKYHVSLYGHSWLAHCSQSEDIDIPEPKWEGGLPHRWGIGAFAIATHAAGAASVSTNCEPSGTDYNVDVLAKSARPDASNVVGEVISRHNNVTRDIQTYEKTEYLSARGYKPVYIFVSLSRWREVLQAWQRHGQIEFDQNITDYDTNRLRELIMKKYASDPTIGIAEGYTISELHKLLFTYDSAPENTVLCDMSPPSKRDIIEIDW